MDGPLVNRVRSGRKQPRRAWRGSSFRSPGAGRVESAIRSRVLFCKHDFGRPRFTAAGASLDHRPEALAKAMSESNSGAGRSGAQCGYRVLARKYRPRDFTDLMVGQEPMVRTLTNAFETGRIAQAYMFTGVRGVGKTTTARILARAFNYKTKDIDRPSIDLTPPGEHCQAIMEGRHVDVIEMDAASHTGIDDIREIVEQVRYKPVSARYKVYIVDEVHMLSAAAFNGLLKTLEEPPEHVKFIFATTEIRKVPVTILSRCQRFDLRRIDSGELAGLFSAISAKEGVSVEPEAIAMIARAAEGSARDGLSLLDRAIADGGNAVKADAVRAMLGLADRARIADLFGHVMRGDAAAALGEFASQYADGASPVLILTDLADFTHLVTRLKYVASARRDASLSESERMRGAEFADSLSVTTLSRAWQMLLKGIPETESASRPASAAEMVLIRLAHAASLPSPEDMARRILDMEGGGVNAPDGGRKTEGAASAPETGNPVETRKPAGTAARRQDPPQNTPPAVPDPAQPEVSVSSLEELAALCSEKRDPKLKALVRGYVRLVRLEPGRLEINLKPEAPPALAGDLQRRLEEWTGRRWLVILSREAGRPTLAEQEAANHEARLADARQDPDVAAIIARFPGAKVAAVRILQ